MPQQPRLLDFFSLLFDLLLVATISRHIPGNRPWHCLRTSPPRFAYRGPRQVPCLPALGTFSLSGNITNTNPSAGSGKPLKKLGLGDRYAPSTAAASSGPPSREQVRTCPCNIPRNSAFLAEIAAKRESTRELPPTLRSKARSAVEFVILSVPVTLDVDRTTGVFLVVLLGHLDSKTRNRSRQPDNAGHLVCELSRSCQNGFLLRLAPTREGELERFTALVLHLCRVKLNW